MAILNDEPNDLNLDNVTINPNSSEWDNRAGESNSAVFEALVQNISILNAKVTNIEREISVETLISFNLQNNMTVLKETLDHIRAMRNNSDIENHIDTLYEEIMHAEFEDITTLNETIEGLESMMKLANYDLQKLTIRIEQVNNITIDRLQNFSIYLSSQLQSYPNISLLSKDFDNISNR